MSHTITPNAGLLHKHPLVGKGLIDPPEIPYHCSSLVGYLGAVVLIPEYDTTILVDTNTLATSDTANWIASMVLAAVLDAGMPSDYISIVHEARAISEARFPQMLRALESDHFPGTPIRSLSEYVGQYYNGAQTFYIDIFLDESRSGLLFSMGGFRMESYQLKHHKYDTWSWAIDYKEVFRRGRWPNPYKDFYILEFASGKDGKIDRIVWKHDPDVPEGEMFRKAAN